MKHLNLHPWEVSPKEAIRIQLELAKKIVLKDTPAKIKTVAGADVSFSPGGEVAYGAVVVLNFPDLSPIEEVRVKAPLKFPYIPGLLTFREGPILLQTFERVKEKPDLIVFGGQGIAHPRRMGLATHMGVLLDKPSIGCAKTHLWGRFDEKKVEEEKGSYTLLKEKKGDVLGAVLRTRSGVKPVFISPGHKITLKHSIDIILKICPKFRLPEPLRLAHTLSKEGRICKKKNQFTTEDAEFAEKE
ncbi:deoxyribonuclease V [bacterium]|nr:deoxyribonuclease V [bacterium]